LLDVISNLRPPAPTPQRKPLRLLALLRVLASNPVEAWTQDHFEKPIVMGGLSMCGLSIGRVAVVSDPSAIRRVLLDNCQNYQKDWLQRRILSAGLTNGLLTAEGNQWRTQRRALAPLFARRSVMNFAAAMIDAAAALVERLNSCEGQIVDLAVEATRVTLEVLERTMFSDGLGRDPEEIRVAMKSYFEAIGRIDPFDVLGVPSVVPRPRRWKVRSTLRLFESAIDSIISTRYQRIAKDPGGVPRDILTLLLEARDPQSGEALREVEVRANILTFIAAGHETTSINPSISRCTFLLTRSV
jgi:cytochrome P450